MKTKSKKFSRKLLALFLAVLMAASCFTGVMTAYASSSDIGYTDDDVEYNSLAWNVLSDEQVATALLDFADEYLPLLKEMEPSLAKTVNSLDMGTFSIYWDADARTMKLSYGITLATFTVKLGSVDELLETVDSVQDVLDGTLMSVASGLGIDLGVINDIDLSATYGMRRSNSSSCDIIRAVLGLIYDNNLSILGDTLRGDLSLGIIGYDVYDLIGDALGCDDGYEENLVYNIVQTLIFNNTDWYTDEEIEAYKADPDSFTFDDVLLKAMSEQLLDKINVLVTYPDGTSSKTRRAEIDALMESGFTYVEACEKLGYDSNLVYSEENTGNILLFVYGDEKLEFTTSDSLFTLGYDALKLAWNTVLQETLNLVHVNYSVDRGHGTNFDNQYYYWATENFTWSTSDLASNYTSERINAWAEDVYESYDASSAEEFLEWVQHNYEFDRTADEDSTGSWDDIDEETLFNKLRYSPLADYGFDMQTGPINLYLMQTGTANLDAFFESYEDYSSLVGGLNDALVAAVKDLFPDSDNIYTSAVGDTDRPEMATVNPSSIDASSISDITSTLISNTLKMVQYVADTTDQNILYAFYQDGGTKLTEDNLESAMIPLLIACIGQINLTGYKLEDMIHPEDWDRCKDAEAVAFVCLREYLSYVLPEKDYDSLAIITDTEITADFEDCILPMARDAIIYVIEPYVPVTDADGVSWTADTEEVDTETSIFDLLNSVVCYYADNYTFTNTNRTDETTMGVASLLGICDEKGLSLINTDNSLWENIDLVVNTLLPVAGTLQAGDSTGYGNFSSYSLIWEDIVEGIFEISDTNETTGLNGVSNFIYRLLTIVSAEPIQNTSIVVTIYDLLEDLLNAMFGPRYSNQSWTPIPESSSSTPFDDFLQADVISGTSSSDPGVICIAINNFIEFSGYGGNGVTTYNNNSSDEHDSLLPGLTFALVAVNSFLDIIPQISEHTLETATADIEDATLYGCTSSGSYQTTASLTNNSTGVNVAYVDGINNEVEQLSRYYLQVTDVTVEGTGTGGVTGYTTSLIAPGEACEATVSTPFVDSDGVSSYTITFTYNICDADGTLLCEGLTANTYRYMTSDTSWMDTVYPEDRYSDDTGINYLASSLETDSADTTKTLDGYTTQSTSAFGTSDRLNALYPTVVVLDNASLSDANTLGVRIRNTTNSVFGTSCSCDGIYYYDEGTYYDDNTGTDVTIGSDNAVPVFDKTTGDILKYDYYDVSYDDGTNWDTNNGSGYTESELESLTGVSQIRTHIAYTLAELIEGGAVAAYHVNERTGQYEYIYLQSAGSYTYDNVLGNITVRGPVDGFYLNSTKVTVSKGSSTYMIFMQYDGSTEISNTQVTANINFYSGSKSAQGSFELYICDTSSASDVQDYVDELEEVLATYTRDDFTDGDAVYDAAEEAVLEGLKAIGTPLTPTTALTLADETEQVYVTSETTATYGDLAYVPMTEDNMNSVTTLNSGAKNLLYLDEDTGYYYFDDDYTIPVYIAEKLTESDVTDGYDAVGMPVTAVTDEDGNTSYYITNTAVYEQEWDTTSYSYPYLAYTDTQATDSDGNLLYDQIQWSYYDANGNKVTSKDDWAFKKPDTNYQAIVNDGTDYRGTYSKAADLLAYTIEYVYSMLQGNAGDILLENVSLVRNNLNETNFDIITYNKMVSMAKTIESKYSIIIDYVGEDGENYTDTIDFSDYNGYVNNDNITINSITTTSTLSTTQAQEYQRLFEFFMSKVVERGYLGDKLEAEILCASNNTYDALTAVAEVTDEDGNVTTAASVTSTDTSNDPEFGAFNSSGELVNEGAVIYQSDLWDNYVTALAKAVSLATLGNGDYAHIDEDYYDASADDYDARVTAVYDAKIDLQVAEIALEACPVLTIADAEGGSVTVDGDAYTAALAYEEGTEVVIEATADSGYVFQGFSINGSEDLVTDNPYTLALGDSNVTVTPVFVTEDTEGHSVSGTLVMATSSSGSTDGKSVYGVYTINVYSDADRTELVDTFESIYTDTDKTNSFELSGLSSGTYYLTVSGDYAITRKNITLVVSDDDITKVQIVVVACDFDQDRAITGSDSQIVDSVVLSTEVGDIVDFCDLDTDGNVSGSDSQIVNVFTTNGYNLPAVTIQ